MRRVRCLFVARVFSVVDEGIPPFGRTPNPRSSDNQADDKLCDFPPSLLVDQLTCCWRVYSVCREWAIFVTLVSWTMLYVCSFGVSHMVDLLDMLYFCLFRVSHMVDVSNMLY